MTKQQRTALKDAIRARELSYRDLVAMPGATRRKITTIRAELAREEGFDIGQRRGKVELDHEYVLEAHKNRTGSVEDLAAEHGLSKSAWSVRYRKAKEELGIVDKPKTRKPNEPYVWEAPGVYHPMMTRRWDLASLRL